MLIIGEKIDLNQEDIRKEVEKRNEEFIQELARSQVECGAQVLDLIATIGENVLEHMRWLVKTVQEAVDVPLCLDSPDYRVIKAGLEVYSWDKGKKPIIDSTTAEKEKFNLILPLVKKYQCPVVALTMDDRGILDNSLERFKIADKLIKELISEGVPLEDIYIDPIVFPIGVDTKSGDIALETIRKIKEAYPTVKTSIGLSNISYGLPERRLINQSFMILAMASGLDAAILDPTDKKLMSLIKAANVLLDKDEFCLQYIKAFREGKLK